MAIESGLDKEESCGYLLLGTLGSSDFYGDYCYNDYWGLIISATSFVRHLFNSMTHGLINVRVINVTPEGVNIRKDTLYERRRRCKCSPESDGPNNRRYLLPAPAQVVFQGNFGPGIPDNRVSLNAGFDRHPASSVSLAAASFCASPRAHNDSTPPVLLRRYLPSPISLSLSLSLSLSFFALSLFLYFSLSPFIFSAPFHLSSRSNRDSALRLFAVRSLPGGRRPQTIRVYAITPLARRERETPGEKVHLHAARRACIGSPAFFRSVTNVSSATNLRAKLISCFFAHLPRERDNGNIVGDCSFSEGERVWLLNLFNVDGARR